MNIAILTETFLPKVDGIVTTVCQTVRQLRRLGHEVLIIAPDGGPAEYEQCRVIGIPGHPFFFYPELRLSFPRSSILRDLDEFQPDIIHAVEPVCLGIAALYSSGGRDGGRLRLPLAVSYHTDLPKYLAHFRLRIIEPYIWPLLRLRHNRATVNLCTSTPIVKDLEDHGIERVALWPGGVDTDRFRPDRWSGAMRSRLTAGHPESPLLLYAGRLSAEKTIERLLPVLRAIPQARLALVGDGPHRPALERDFAGFPVTMTGFLHGDELAEAFASSDVFVMPSKTETLGLVVLEAMASGMPVVGARAGGVPEMIEEGVNGFLFDNEAQATASVGQLIADRVKRDAMGRAARATAQNRSWEAATCRLVEHYRNACAMQHLAPVNAPAPENLSLSLRARSALGAATDFAFRKFLP